MMWTTDMKDIAVTIAEQFESQLEFLHVIVDPIPLGYYEAGLEGLFTVDSALKERSLEKLKEFIAKTEPNYCYTVIEGAPFEQITEHARDAHLAWRIENLRESQTPFR